MSTQYQSLTIGLLDENDEIYQTQEISLNDFDIERSIDADQRQMGSELTHQLTYEGNNFSLTGYIYEYPEGTYNDHSWETSGSIKILKDNLDYFDFCCLESDYNDDCE